MAGSTFNVKEFGPVYAMIEENSGRISTTATRVVSLCEQLSQILRSTDSELSNAYLRIAEAISMAKTKAVDLLQQLTVEIRTYEARTVANEETTNEELNKINKNIEEIAGIFNSIAGKVS